LSIGASFINAADLPSAIRVLDESFTSLRFDYEKAEDDVFFTDPPLEQIARIAETEKMTPDDLIGRIETAQSRLREFQSFEDDDDNRGIAEGTPLHLMTATRAKGKEFDTVVLLDTNEEIWPLLHVIKSKDADERHRQIEAERRLFSVAFPRARRRVVLLTSDDVGPISRFVKEAGLA